MTNSNMLRAKIDESGYKKKANMFYQEFLQELEDRLSFRR